MKHDIQLYVNGQLLDLFEDESLQITSSIQDVKDVSVIFTDYSQSFSVKASRNNNLVFKHFHDNSITNGYDARYKLDAVIEVNHQFFRRGKVRLDGVQMKNNRAYAYKITFIGESVKLKDLLGEDLLSDIDFSTYDTYYTLSEVATYVQNGKTVDGVTNAIISPLISAENRFYYNSGSVAVNNLADLTGGGGYFKNIKYAIRLYCIIKEIENKYTVANGYNYNLVFSNDFFSASVANFYDLYLWLHREKGLSNIPLEETQVNQLPTQGWSTYGFATQGDKFVITDSATNTYDVSFNLYVTSDSPYNVVLLKDDEEYRRNDNLWGNSTPVWESLPNGTYKIIIQHEDTMTLLSTSNLYVTRNSTQFQQFNFGSSQSLTDKPTFVVSDNMPEIKVIDFLTGLFKMFNLTAYFEDGTLVVKPLNTFYADGTTYDITKYVDVTDSEVNTASLFNKMEFKYKGLSSLQTLKHKELFNVDWGTEEYNIEDKFDGKPYIVEVPFEHMKYEKLAGYNYATESTTIQVGWMVGALDDSGNADPILGEPLVFYAPRVVNGTQMRIIGNYQTGTPEDADYVSINDYYVPSNSRLLTDSQNINFKAEINEYTYAEMANTLFFTYYKDYIDDVFDYRNRIVRINAVLPLNILTKYKLNDRFIIGDKSYKINSISSNLLNNKSNIELIPDL